MGLSNIERIRGIYYSVNEIVRYQEYIKKNLQDFEKLTYSKLLDLIDNLWDSFIGNNNNSTHWLFGSSATNTVTHSTTTPWGIAINHHCDNIESEEEYLFDAFDGFLNISGLLGNAEPKYSHVYNIYAQTEQVIYYLRRYNDDLLEKFSKLSCNISQIQGECFNIFISDNVYGAAYILYRICILLYDSDYPYTQDLVTSFLIKENIHHYLIRGTDLGHFNIKELSEMHKLLSNNCSMMNRLEVMMKICGRHFHYDHIFKNLKSMLKTDKTFTKENIEKLEKLFEENKEKHKIHEENSRKEYQKNKESELSIY